MNYIFVVLLLLYPLFVAAEDAEIPEIYEQIADIFHPTLDDYWLIQRYISEGNRAGLARINDPIYLDRVLAFKIIGDHPDELPQSEIIPVNSDINDKENCVIVYASFNRNYPRGLKRLVKLITDSDFRGHVIYRLGGWPDIEGGSLTLAHVPAAFKACFFKEAQRMGYQRVLWLDTSVVPLVSLNKIFQMINQKGHFVMGNCFMVGPFTNREAAGAFGITLSQAYLIPCCSAGLFGVDFKNKKAARVVDLFYKAALDRDAYYSARLEQNVLSFILYLMGITDFIPISRLPHSPAEIRANSLFLLDREYIN